MHIFSGWQGIWRQSGCDICVSVNVTDLASIPALPHHSSSSSALKDSVAVQGKVTLSPRLHCPFHSPARTLSRQGRISVCSQTPPRALASPGLTGNLSDFPLGCFNLKMFFGSTMNTKVPQWLGLSSKVYHSTRMSSIKSGLARKLTKSWSEGFLVRHH